MKRLVIVGAGGHGAVVAEAAAQEGLWQEILFLDDDPTLDTVVDVPIVGRANEVFSVADRASEIVVAVGDNRQRLNLCDEIEAKGLNVATITHPAAHVSKSATILRGTVVLAGVIVNARARIGRACILNTGATIDHDCVLEDGVHVSPGANLAGNVQVGQCAWIGIGSSVREGVVIGRDSIIGAGAAVISTVGDALTVGGVPAKVMSTQ